MVNVPDLKGSLTSVFCYRHKHRCHSGGALEWFDFVFVSLHLSQNGRLGSA